MQILDNNYKFKHQMPLMKYIRGVIFRRPRQNFFKESMKGGYENESDFFDKMGKLLADMITHQKSQENKMDEF